METVLDPLVEYLKTRIISTTYEDQKWNVKGDLTCVCKITLDNGMVFKGNTDKLSCYTEEQVRLFSLRNALYEARAIFSKIKTEVEFQKIALWF